MVTPCKTICGELQSALQPAIWYWLDQTTITICRDESIARADATDQLLGYESGNVRWRAYNVDCRKEEILRIWSVSKHGRHQGASQALAALGVLQYRGRAAADMVRNSTLGQKALQSHLHARPWLGRCSCNIGGIPTCRLLL